MDPALAAVIAFLVGSAVLWLTFRSRGGKAPERLLEVIDEGAVVVDVRTAGEYARGHVRGAVNIPVDRLGLRLDELDDKDRPVVVYCASGMRSARAASILRQAGFTDVLDARTLGAFPPERRE